MARFEAAVEAVTDGDVLALRGALEADPTLALARSTRVTHVDPPKHRATPISMPVSSDPPARAGVQIALIELLADQGATRGAGTGRSGG